MSEHIYGTDGHEGHWLTGEKIVRCRDCKHFTPEGTIRFPDGSANEDYCDYFKAYKLQITPNGFCAWGEEGRMKGLKPCPFCGSEYQTVEDLGWKPASECHAGKHWYVINCLDCGGSMRGFGRKEMIVAWNRRVDHEIQTGAR